MEKTRILKFPGLRQDSEVLFLTCKNERLADFVPQLTLSSQLHTQLSKVQSDRFDTVCGITNVPYPPVLLAHILRVLKPGGTVAIQVPSSADIRRSLLFGGFDNIQQLDIQSENEQNEVQLVATKPQIRMTAAKLNLKSKPKYDNDTLTSSQTENKAVEKTTTDSAAAGAKQWSFNSTDITDDIGLEDEDALLDHETEKVSIPKTSIMQDCGVEVSSSRKPCQNCTCGRAKKWKEQQENGNGNGNGNKDAKEITSACGKCHLGDAFRCASCPFLGMPAFDPAKTGDAVKLSLATDDI